MQNYMPAKLFMCREHVYLTDTDVFVRPHLSTQLLGLGLKSSPLNCMLDFLTATR
jgi:hypothetical protein